MLCRKESHSLGKFPSAPPRSPSLPLPWRGRGSASCGARKQYVMSSDLAVSSALKELLASSIRSVEEIDLLLHLHGQRAAQTALELAGAMRLPEASTVAALQNLMLSRLVVQVGNRSPLRYAFAPAPPELREAVDELARVYRDCRLDIIVLISSQALERVRSGALRAFTDLSWSERNKRK
jgi:hypothetical protein